MLFRFRKESALERLEREASDDFRLLKELGPTYFDSMHLVDLRETIRKRLDHFDRTKKTLMLLSATGTVSFLAGVICLLLGWKVLALLGYVMSVACILTFVGGTVWLKWKYESRGELLHVLLEVEEELRNRTALKGRGATSR
ncbi:MAG: hypothetical protein NZM43_06080 [Saprospiraceae bacterium]|nr:hypothetical protein [Saprospiraceae bacterium]MDW8483878.1 hypothetical protein [Saprospiraceae bacterium]